MEFYTRVSEEEPFFIGDFGYQTYKINKYPILGNFLMFIHHERFDVSRASKIDGRIEDCLGIAQFEGEITENEIKFTKRYNEGDFLWGTGIVNYDGKKESKDDFYNGEYTAIGGVKEGIICDWTGNFVIMEFNHENNYLIREMALDWPLRMRQLRKVLTGEFIDCDFGGKGEFMQEREKIRLLQELLRKKDMTHSLLSLVGLNNFGITWKRDFSDSHSGEFLGGALRDYITKLETALLLKPQI